MTAAIALVAQWALVVPAVFVAAAIMMRARWRADLVEAALDGLMTIVLVKIAGTLYFEPRPFIVEHLQPLVPHAPDNAFPSDHLAAIGLGFAFLWPRSRTLALVTLLVAAAVGTARVLARLHSPTDIFSGFALGVLAVVLVRGLCAFVARRRPGS